MSTFNYSKLATLVPKGLQEEKAPGGQPETPPRIAKPKKTSQDTKKTEGMRSTDSHRKNQPAKGVGPRPEMVGSQPPPTVEAQTSTAPIHTPPEEINSAAKTSKYRKPVHVTRHTIWLPHKISADLTAYCGEKGVALSEFVTEAVKQLLKSVDVNDFDVLASSDFDALASVNPTKNPPPLADGREGKILELFQTYTGKKPTPKDRRMAAPFQLADPRLIEIAMIETVERKLRGNTAKFPIRSFTYFIPEIENTLALNQNREFPGTLAEYHRFVLNNWLTRIKPLRDEKWKHSEQPD